VRDRSGGVDREAAADGGDERAPVSSVAALWLTVERGRWLRCDVGAERRKSWRGGANFGRWRWGAPFKVAGRGGVGRRGRRVEEAARAGGVPVDRRAAPGRERPETGGHVRRALCMRCWPNRGGGERRTSGSLQQCRVVVPPTSGARRAAGEGERGGTLTSGTGLSAGVDGGEAAAARGPRGPAREEKRWAEPR
jgi:hypothetical protein